MTCPGSLVAVEPSTSLLLGNPGRGTLWFVVSSHTCTAWCIAVLLTHRGDIGPPFQAVPAWWKRREVKVA